MGVREGGRVGGREGGGRERERERGGRERGREREERREKSVEGEGEEIGNGILFLASNSLVAYLALVLLEEPSCMYLLPLAHRHGIIRCEHREHHLVNTHTLPALDNLLSSFFLDKLSMALVGSDPMDRKQTMGTRGLDSSHTFSMSRITPSANFTPMASAMYLRAWAAVRSGHQDLNHIQLLLSAVELLCEAVTLSVAAF